MKSSIINWKGNSIANFLDKKRVRIGKRVSLEVDDLEIGDGVFIGDDVVIEGPKVSIGDYTMINSGTTIGGRAETSVGMCCWFGPDCILNATEMLTIGNGVGAGARSQFWTHARFGDTLQGCRFDVDKPMVIEDDVWFVGQCLVSPIHAGPRSMAMLGSVIVKDMASDRTYGGAPANDITDRVGPQYVPVSVDEKFAHLSQKLAEFEAQRGSSGAIEIIKEWPKFLDPQISYFNVSDRCYTKRLSEEEIDFMLHLLVPIKFYPAQANFFLSASTLYDFNTARSFRGMTTTYRAHA